MNHFNRKSRSIFLKNSYYLGISLCHRMKGKISGLYYKGGYMGYKGLNF